MYVSIHKIIRVITMKMKMKMKADHIDTTKIDLSINMNINKVNKKRLPVWRCFYVLSNI